MGRGSRQTDPSTVKEKHRTQSIILCLGMYMWLNWCLFSNSYLSKSNSPLTHSSISILLWPNLEGQCTLTVPRCMPYCASMEFGASDADLVPTLLLLCWHPSTFCAGISVRVCQLMVSTWGLEVERWPL